MPPYCSSFADGGSLSVHDIDNGLSGASSANCGTCKSKVGDDAIKSDKCSRGFHTLSICLGLPEKSIDDIVKLDGKRIFFVCLSCRINRPDSSWGECVPSRNNQDMVINWL